MTIEFIKMERATNGQWMAIYSRDNETPDFVWLTDFQVNLIESAQRAARNEVRKKINDALRYERLDGRNPV